MEHVGGLDTAEAGAAYFHDLYIARTVTVSSYADGRYQDLVNVGHIESLDARFPDDCMYPDSMYPLSTRELNTHGGYFTTDLDDAAYEEFTRSRHDPDVISILGVAMVTSGVLRGEIFMTRGRAEHPFDRSDLDLARDLATTFGSMLHMAMRRANP